MLAVISAVHLGQPPHTHTGGMSFLFQTDTFYCCCHVCIPQDSQKRFTYHWRGRREDAGLCSIGFHSNTRDYSSPTTPHASVSCLLTTRTSLVQAQIDASLAPDREREPFPTSCGQPRIHQIHTSSTYVKTTGTTHVTMNCHQPALIMEGHRIFCFLLVARGTVHPTRFQAQRTEWSGHFRGNHKRVPHVLE